MSTTQVEQGAAEVMRLARALAVGGTSTAAFVAAIGGTIQGTEFRRVNLLLPGSSFSHAVVQLARGAPMGGDPQRWPPESVTLEADSAANGASLHALSELFGPWVRGVPGPEGHDFWNVRFDTRVGPDALQRTAEPRRETPPGHPVRVSAVLDEDPGQPRARVLRVTLARDN